MENGGSLPPSEQQANTLPCPEPDKFSSRSQILSV